MSSMTLKENFETLLKNFKAVTSFNVELKSHTEKLEKQNEYLRKQVGNDMKQKQKALESPTASVHGDEEASNLVNSSSEEPLRRIRGARRMTKNSNDFKVEIPEFEGKLDPDEFLEWLHTVERVFEYKKIPDDKKVKLVAL